MLGPGTTIGKFEVIERLGAGGMGEVWKASDTSLGRYVALKSLPADLAEDSGRLARLEREAKLLASLNHPNIASIYGLERTGDACVLELELVEGRPLNEVLQAGPIPLSQVLEIALQIVDALEAAHAKGVVHRDLKPANIMLTPDGTVKVLDFGVAKTFSGGGGEADARSAVTATMTEQGKVLGTPAYMSPEQARGVDVDAQTDIWAFGCIVFELLTGSSPFEKGTPVETLGRVLEREPDLDSLPATTPAAIRRLIRRCLQKDRRNRLHHISDARLDIREALDPAMAEPDSRIAPAARSRIVPLMVVVAALALIGTGVWLASSRSGDADVASEETFAAGPSFQSPIIIVGDRGVSLSSTGSHLAYGADGRIVLRSIGGPAVTETQPAGLNPFFSSTGDAIAFYADGGLNRASIFDGIRVRVTDQLGSGRFLGGTWHDETIYFVLQDGVYSVAADAEAAMPELVFATPDDRSIAWPEVLPDGTAMLLTVLPGNSIDRAYIALLDLVTLELSGPLVRGVSARYLSLEGQGEDYIVYATGSGRLNVRAFDPSTRVAGAVPVDVAAVDVRIDGSYLSAAFDVADNGTLVYVNPRERSSASMSWIDRDGQEEPIDVLLPGTATYPRISPDGRRLAMDIGATTPSRRIWQVDLEIGNATQVSDLGATGPVYEDFQALWSRDGERIFFATTRTGVMEIFSSPVDRIGGDIPYAFNPDVIVPLVATLDDRLVVMGGTFDLGILDAENRIEWLMQSPTRELAPALSPDGNWIAYISDRTGNFEIWVAPFPVSGEQGRLISSNGGAYPVWGPAGSNEIYYIGFNEFGDPAMLYATLDLSGDQVARVGQGSLFNREFLRQYTTVPGLRPYDVSPVDGRFLFVRYANLDLTTVWLTRNWLRVSVD